MTTTSTQNYLKAIRELCDGNRRVTTCVLARHLHVAPASVTNMVQRLAADDLVDYVPYRGVALTEVGEREAKSVLHKHGVVERYLVNVLGFDDAQAHAEAERWEHCISDEMMSRLQALAN
jgi:DtxR family Mn-dependent transcriptional regulator